MTDKKQKEPIVELTEAEFIQAVLELQAVITRRANSIAMGIEVAESEEAVKEALKSLAQLHDINPELYVARFL